MIQNIILFFLFIAAYLYQLDNHCRYPFRFYYDNLALFDFHCIEWHWHVEFEFVYVENGTAVFSVGEKQVTLEAGQGFFVNSKVLHRFYSKEGAVIPNFVFVPTFIAPQSSLIYKKYVEPIEHSTLEGLTFLPEIPWQADILHVMEKIVQVQKEEKDDELKTSFLVQELWYLIYLHVEETKLEEKKEDFTSSQARLQLMMQYIHQHFGEKISLEDIAEQAVVSKSTWWSAPQSRRNPPAAPTNNRHCPDGQPPDCRGH